MTAGLWGGQRAALTSVGHRGFAGLTPRWLWTKVFVRYAVSLSLKSVRHVSLDTRASVPRCPCRTQCLPRRLPSGSLGLEHTVTVPPAPEGGCLPPGSRPNPRPDVGTFGSAPPSVAGLLGLSRRGLVSVAGRGDTPNTQRPPSRGRGRLQGAWRGPSILLGDQGSEQRPRAPPWGGPHDLCGPARWSLRWSGAEACSARLGGPGGGPRELHPPGRPLPRPPDPAPRWRPLRPTGATCFSRSVRGERQGPPRSGLVWTPKTALLLSTLTQWPGAPSCIRATCFSLCLISSLFPQISWSDFSSWGMEETGREESRAHAAGPSPGPSPGLRCGQAPGLCRPLRVTRAAD